MNVGPARNGTKGKEARPRREVGVTTTTGKGTTIHHLPRPARPLLMGLLRTCLHRYIDAWLYSYINTEN